MRSQFYFSGYKRFKTGGGRYGLYIYTDLVGELSGEDVPRLDVDPEPVDERPGRPVPKQHISFQEKETFFLILKLFRQFFLN